MEQEQDTSAKRKWLVYLAWLFLGLLAFRFAGLFFYKLIVPKTAQELSYFQNLIIDRSPYYTTISFGSFAEQLLSNSIFTFILWFFTIMILYFIQKVFRSFPYELTVSIINKVIFLLWTYTCLAIFFIPQLKTEFNPDDTTMTLKRYNTFLYIWVKPFPYKTYKIPFRDINSIEFGSYNQYELDVKHQMMGLYALTNADTFLIGRRMVKHGEFGWLDFSKNLYKSAEKEGSEAASYLNQLIHKKIKN